MTNGFAAVRGLCKIYIKSKETTRPCRLLLNGGKNIKHSQNGAVALPSFNTKNKRYMTNGREGQITCLESLLDSWKNNRILLKTIGFQRKVYEIHNE